MNTKFPDYKYKGFVAVFDEEIEYDADGCPENRKIYHWVKPPDGGKEVIIDWSSYSVPTFDEFKLWVDLECPDRFATTFEEKKAWFPLDGKALKKIYNWRFHSGCMNIICIQQGYL